MKTILEGLLNLILRGIIGALAIFFLNMACSKYNIQVSVGINPVSITAMCLLGLPGLIVLYGIGFYRLL